MAPDSRPFLFGINSFRTPDGKHVKDRQFVEEGQHYSKCQAELVSASNEFEALGDPGTK